MKVTSLRGNVFHIEKDAVAQILLDAGICSLVVEAPKPVTPAQWDAGVELFSRRPFIEFKRGNEKMRFMGAQAAPTYGGETCPADIFAKFRDLLKAYRPAKPRNENDDLS